MTDGEARRRRPRRLRDDERKLWVEVARSVKPLKSKPPLDMATPEKRHPASAVMHQAPPPPAPAGGTAKPKAPSGSPSPPPLAPLGRRLRQRIGRGSEPIERRLDLHGMTQHEAHDALAHFLRRAHADDARMVLVITGKGLRTDDDPYRERGVLRRLVPQWLRLPEFRTMVVGFESAGIGHGGEGALYVRLRRRRNA